MAVAIMPRHAEGVCIDADRLIELYASQGEAGAERTIRAAVDVILGSLAGGIGPDARRAEAAGRAAARIGMVTLARVAGDLAHLARSGDDPARAAVAERLRRIADTSLAELRALRYQAR